MTQTNVPLKEGSSRGRSKNRGSGSGCLADGDSRRKVQLVDLIKTLRITMPRASTKQIPHAAALDTTRVGLKNNTIVTISDLTSRHKLHSKLGNMRDDKNMQRRSGKDASAYNRKRGIICSLNNGRKSCVTHRSEMSGIWCYVKRSTRVQDPGRQNTG